MAMACGSASVSRFAAMLKFGIYRTHAIRRPNGSTRLLKHSYRPKIGENAGEGFVDRFVYGNRLGNWVVTKL